MNTTLPVWPSHMSALSTVSALPTCQRAVHSQRALHSQHAILSALRKVSTWACSLAFVAPFKFRRAFHRNGQPVQVCRGPQPRVNEAASLAWIDAEAAAAMCSATDEIITKCLEQKQEAEGVKATSGKKWFQLFKARNPLKAITP